MRLGIGQPKVKRDGNILEIDVPKQMEEAIPTGHPHIDLLYAGDGIIAGTVSLVSGGPGAGKTTLMLQLADSLTRMGHKSIVNTGEESLYQVRRVTKRLDLKHGFIPSYHRDAEDIIEHCEEIRAKYPGKQLFLIQDSLQCLSIRPSGKRGRPVGAEQAKIIGLEKLTEYAKNNWVTLFLIGHVNKKGEFAGKQTIKHIVDCHLHLSFDPEYEERVCEMRKNRFGIAGCFYNFDLQAKGLVFEAARATAVDVDLDSDDNDEESDDS